MLSHVQFAADAKRPVLLDKMGIQAGKEKNHPGGHIFEEGGAPRIKRGVEGFSKRLLHQSGFLDYISIIRNGMSRKRSSLGFSFSFS